MSGRAHYAAGRRFEHQVQAALEDAGYLTVRSAGSRTKVDIVAIEGPHVLVLLVQCKRDGRCDPGEWNELYSLAKSFGCIAILASKPKRTEPIRWEQLTGRKGEGVARPAVAFIPGDPDPWLP